MEKKKIKEIIIQINSFEETNIDSVINDLINFKKQGATHIDIHGYLVNVIKYRLETDEELSQRVMRLTKIYGYERKRNLETYEHIKKKYNLK